MGLFSFSIEDKLKKLYTNTFVSMGMSNSKAVSTTKEMIKKSKELVREKGEDKLVDNFGDRLLMEVSSKKMINILKENGVRDEDIKWWWNMHPLERQMMLQMDEFHKMPLMMKEFVDTGSMDEAVKKVTKYHPIFGDVTDESKFTGEDKPLPFEIKDRINIYIEKRSKENDKKYKNDIEESSSFNALVRKEIKAGKL